MTTERCTPVPVDGILHKHATVILSGILLRGLTQRRHEGLRGVLPSDQRNNVLVPEGVLRARGGRRRLDSKYLEKYTCIMCAMFTETKKAFSVLNTCRRYKFAELSYTSMPGEGLHFSGERSIVANSANLHVRITKNKNSPR